MGATLKDRQWELDERLLFGLGTGIMVNNFSFGETDFDNDIRKLPNADGVMFGPESYGGRKLTFDIIIETSVAPEYADSGVGEFQADALMERLEAGWRSCRNRTVIIRYRMMGRTRRVYGHVGKLSPPPDGWTARHGYAKYTLEFDCQDGFTYSDTLETTELRMTPTDGTGFTVPFGGTITMQGENPPIPGLITVAGSFPVSIAAELYGPIDNPVIDVTALWDLALDYSLGDGRMVEIDSSLQNRGIRLDGTKNIAGKLNKSISPKLSGCLIPPGQWSVILRGKSSTGTARCVLKWRQCFVSY